ncbi:MAG: hypothetical protein CL424_01825 [Acidimicrobiaceae bacterium]|nr:hypothetical protein [Acidimicrobiaceae bacterium]
MHEAVDPEPAEERDVVADDEVIDAGRSDLSTIRLACVTSASRGIGAAMPMLSSPIASARR